VLGVDLGGEREELFDVALPRGADAARVPDDALGVDENGGPVGDTALLEVDAVFLGDGAPRVEVGEERERDTAEIPRPVGVRVAAIDAYARDTRIGFRLKAIGQRFQRRNFAASRRCPVEGVEEQEDVVPTAVVAEVELGSKMGLEGEVRGFGSDAYHKRTYTSDGLGARWELRRRRSELFLRALGERSRAASSTDKPERAAGRYTAQTAWVRGSVRAQGSYGSRIASASVRASSRPWSSM
jgi:hypothetical protein